MTDPVGGWSPVYCISKSLLNAITRQHTSETLIELFTSITVPISKIKTIPEVIEDPLVRSRLLTAEDPVTGREIMLAPPPSQTNFIASRGRRLSFPPRFGQDNADIYGRLGHDADSLEQLKSKGII